MESLGLRLGKDICATNHCSGLSTLLKCLSLSMSPYHTIATLSQYHCSNHCHTEEYYCYPPLGEVSHSAPEQCHHSKRQSVHTHRTSNTTCYMHDI